MGNIGSSLDPKELAQEIIDAIVAEIKKQYKNLKDTLNDGYQTWLAGVNMLQNAILNIFVNASEKLEYETRNSFLLLSALLTTEIILLIKNKVL